MQEVERRLGLLMTAVAALIALALFLAPAPVPGDRIPTGADVELLSRALFSSTSISSEDTPFYEGVEPYIEFNYTTVTGGVVPSRESSGKDVYNSSLFNVSFDVYYKNGTVARGARLADYRIVKRNEVTRAENRSNYTMVDLGNGTVVPQFQNYYNESVNVTVWNESSFFGDTLQAGSTGTYRLVGTASALSWSDVRFVKWTGCIVDACVDPAWTVYAEVANLSKNWSTTQNNPWLYQYFDSNGTRINMTQSCLGTSSSQYQCWTSGTSAVANQTSTSLYPMTYDVSIQVGAPGGAAYPNLAYVYYFTQNGNYSINGTARCKGSPFCDSGDGMSYTVWLNGSGGTQICTGSITGDATPNAINCHLGNNIPAGARVELDIGANTGSGFDWGNLTAVVYGVTSIPLSVSLVGPANNTATNDSTSMTLSYSFASNTTNVNNCSLYTNASSAWAFNATNSSPLVGGVNNITFQAGGFGKQFLWNVNCSTLGVESQTFASENRTMRTSNNTIWGGITNGLSPTNVSCNMSTQNNTLVEPFGQTGSVGIFNFTNAGSWMGNLSVFVLNSSNTTFKLYVNTSLDPILREVNRTRNVSVFENWTVGHSNMTWLYVNCTQEFRAFFPRLRFTMTSS